MIFLLLLKTSWVSKSIIDANKDGVIKTDDKAISSFAVNGAVWYAKKMIGSGKYNEVIAIGVAGDNEENVEVSVHYVYGSGFETVKAMPTFKNFSFLENKETFARFYEEAQLTTGEKHKILVNSKTNLGNHAKKLNKMLHLHPKQACYHLHHPLLFLERQMTCSSNPFRFTLLNR